MAATDTTGSQETLRICPNCGAWVRRERAGCPWCGTGFRSSASTTAAQAVTESTDDVADHNEFFDSTFSVRFWRRLFLSAAAVLTVLFIVMGTVAVYQGLNDRAVSDARSAVTHYEKGLSYYEEGRYELAAAEFREALRLKPDFDAARQYLAVAEAGVAGQSDDETPRPTAETPAEPDALWTEAVAAYRAGNYTVAAEALERLRTLAPTFQSQEVEQLLFDSYVQAGTVAADTESFDAAVRSFDQALALRPDNTAIHRKRQLAGAYRRGIEALSDEAWAVATTELRQVYILDPTYHEVTSKLAEAHRRYGDEFFERGIWCDAAEQYRESHRVQADANVLDRAKDAESRCTQRVTPPPAPTATETTDERTVPDGTPISGESQFVVRGDIETEFGEACTGHYIKGQTLNEEEAPLVGITVVAIDEWGNKYVAMSKSEPAGSYDMPINSIPAQYEVYVAGTDGVAISPIISVNHTESLAAADRACHVITWQRVVSE